jgi:hypothetical protein
MFSNGVEWVIIETIGGGPYDGRRMVAITKFGNGSWPPPEDMPVVGQVCGVYHRESFSNLSAEEAVHPNVIRDAKYKWVPDGETSDA